MTKIKPHYGVPFVGCFRTDTGHWLRRTGLKTDVANSNIAILRNEFSR